MRKYAIYIHIHPYLRILSVSRVGSPHENNDYHILSYTIIIYYHYCLLSNISNQLQLPYTLGAWVAWVPSPDQIWRDEWLEAALHGLVARPLNQRQFKQGSAVLEVPGYYGITEVGTKVGAIPSGNLTYK